jgi:hypothetical protein
VLEIGINPNGGPTSTLALLPGSPAINAGSEAGSGACEASDQRGAPRADNAIGAYELVRCQDAVVNVVGTAGSDVLRGSGRSDAILALAGADEVFGGGGNLLAGRPCNEVEPRCKRSALQLIAPADMLKC